MRILQISADRSKQGILYPDTGTFKRQEAYAERFGDLDIIALSLRHDGAKAVNVGKLNLRPTNSFTRLLYWWNVLFIAWFLPKPDVVTTQDPFETGFIGWFVAWIRGVPLHVQVHTDFLSPEYAQHSFVNRLRVRIARFVLRRAKRIRVVSNRIRNSLEAKSWKLEASVTVLPIFVDTEHFRWRLPDAELQDRFKECSSRMLVVSRLEPEKDVERAIKLFHEYAPVTACLIIVGDGSLREDLEILARTLHIEHRVFFEGARDAAPYYKLADLIVNTSKYEGYGLVIAEALSAGKPVLSSDVGAARSLGAMVGSSYEELGERMVEWFQGGAREGTLHEYPYKNFEEYVRKYCEDIEKCVQR